VEKYSRYSVTDAGENAIVHAGRDSREAGGAGDATCLQHCIRLAVDKQQIGAGGTFGGAPALFPVAQRVDVEAETRSEGLLGQAETGADGLYVDLGRNECVQSAS
jgi:hypothetical protein